VIDSIDGNKDCVGVGALLFVGNLNGSNVAIVGTYNDLVLGSIDGNNKLYGTDDGMLDDSFCFLSDGKLVGVDVSILDGT